MENNRKRIVLIGKLGHGKTTLFNRLTGANEKTSQGLQSTTRNIILRPSLAKSPEKYFEVVDTPGLGSIDEKMEHIAGILAAFKMKEVNRIIFVLKCDMVDLMIGNIQPTLKFFEKYMENENLLKCKMKQEAKIDKHLKINSVLFNENNSPSYNLNIIKQFNQILEKSQQIRVSLQIDQIIENFDLFELKNEHKFQMQLVDMTQEYYKKVQKPILNFIKNFPKQINDPLYLHYLDELSKFAVEEQLEKFIKDFGQKMNDEFSVNSDNSQYAPFIKLNQTLKLELSMIIEKINQKKQEHPDFIGSKIKACPYCGLVWVRDYGCNRILCGNYAGNYNPISILKPFVKFEYKIENYEVQLIENDIQLFKDKYELINVLKDSFNKKQFQYIGVKFYKKNDRERQFLQILKYINIKKNDNEFIDLLQKEFDNSCFDQWIQIVDKKKYDEFIRNLQTLFNKFLMIINYFQFFIKQTLVNSSIIIYRQQQTKRGNKRQVWLWKVFFMGI